MIKIKSKVIKDNVIVKSNFKNEDFYEGLSIILKVIEELTKKEDIKVEYFIKAIKNAF